MRALLTLAVLLSFLVPSRAATLEPLGNLNPQLVITASDIASRPVPFGSRWIFGAMNRVWITDGTSAGTHAIFTGFTTSQNGFAALGGFAYFTSAIDGTDKIYRTDGTAAGTSAIATLVGPVSAAPVVSNGFMYFSTNQGVWRSDGTSAGTVRISNVGVVDGLKVVGAQLWFKSPQGGLWKTDGFALATQVTPIQPYPNLAIAGSRVVFLTYTGSTFDDFKLMATDGTAAGTVELLPGARWLAYSTIVEMGGNAYVLLRRINNEVAFYRTDGTLAGTQQLGSDTEIFRPYEIASTADRVYFVGGGTTYRVFRSDGTAAGTFEAPLGTYGTWRSHSVIDGKYYAMISGDFGFQLYRFDGDTPVAIPGPSAPWGNFGATLVFTGGYLARPGEDAVVFSPAPGEPDDSSNCGSGFANVTPTRAVFMARTRNDGGCALWVTDGTAAGTSYFYDMPRGSSFGVSTTQLLAAGGVVYYIARFENNGQPIFRLYRTDGTAAGTGPVLAGDGDAVRIPTNAPLGVAGDRLYFAGMDGTIHYAVNGDLHTVAPGPRTVTHFNAAAGPSVYWFETRSPTTAALMRADASDTVTELATVPQLAGQQPNIVVAAGGWLYWTTSGSTNQVWRSDGTAAGTLMVLEQPRLEQIIAGPGTTALFTVNSTTDYTQGELWATDGTAAGTRAISTLVRHILNLSGSEPDGDHVVFMAIGSAEFTYNVMRSDGTSAGTRILMSQSSCCGVSSFFLHDGSYYFAATTSAGQELWATDGVSSAGTHMVLDAVPGSAGSTFGAVNGRVLPSPGKIGNALLTFWAPPTTGAEPYRIVLDATTPPSTSRLTVTVSGSGTVTSSPAGINCGGDCVEDYPANAVVTLTATPATGYTFAGWSGACGGTGSCTLTLSSSTAVVATFSLQQPARPAPNDTNRDGRSDVLWMRPDGSVVAWFMNGAAPSGTCDTVGAGSGWHAAFVADFNADGYADILWRHDDGRVGVWLMQGCTQVGGAILLAANSGWRPTLVGDFNADGKADIVWTHTDGSVAMWLMDGARQAGGARLLGPGSGWRAAFLGDFDADHKADIVWVHTDGGVAMWLMDGAMQVGGARLLLAGSGWSPKALADFDADGRVDIVWEHTDGSSAMWLMDGTRQVGGARLQPSGSDWRFQKAADLDGDGKADLVYRRGDTGFTACLMDGATTRGCGTLTNPISNFTLSATGDYDGDGNADLLFRVPDGTFQLWRMAGLTVLGAQTVAGATGWTVVP